MLSIFQEKDRTAPRGRGINKPPRNPPNPPPPTLPPSPLPFLPSKKKNDKTKQTRTHTHTTLPPFCKTLLLRKPIKPTFSIAETKGSISDRLMLKSNISNSYCVLYQIVIVILHQVYIMSKRRSEVHILANAIFCLTFLEPSSSNKLDLKVEARYLFKSSKQVLQ